MRWYDGGGRADPRLDVETASGHAVWTRIASALERLVDLQAHLVAREREHAEGLARWQHEVSDHQLRMIEIQEEMASRSQAHITTCEREMARRRAAATEDVEVI